MTAGDFLRNSTVARGVQKMALEKVIESYISYYASGKGHTARAKRLDLQRFTQFLISFRGVSSAKKLTVADWDFSSVQRFVDDSLSKGESPATVTRRLATLKHMGRTFAEKVAGFINPAREVKGPRVGMIKPQGLSDAQIAQIKTKARIRLSEKTSFIRLRNQTIFNLLLDTGLRADEIRTLKIGQLDEKLGWIKSVRTKGRRFRNVYVTSAMKADLEMYLDARAKELKRYYSKLTTSHDKALPLFISTYGAKAGDVSSFAMGTKTLWRAVNELSADVKLHPHLLRHSFALDLLHSSKDVRLVAQALGHSDVRTTMRYTERRDEEVAQALEENRRRKKSS